MGMSLKPSEMSAGGGLWGDVDATITGVKFELSDFDGKIEVAVPVLKLEVADDAGVEYEQLLSCGKSGKPNKAGSSLEGAGAINVGSNFGLFITSLVNAGFPENRLEDDIGVLVGLKGRFDRVAAPKRSGLTKAPRADGKVFEDTVLIVSKILKYPWDKEKAGGKGKTTAAKGKAPAKTENTEVEIVADGAVLGLLLENEDGLTKQQLAVQVFNIVKVSHPALKAEIVKLVNTDAYHEGKDWVLEDGIVKMG